MTDTEKDLMKVDVWLEVTPMTRLERKAFKILKIFIEGLVTEDEHVG